MKVPLDVRCLQCGQVFCCLSCRRKHEQVQHNLQYECSICRKQPVKIRIDIGIEEEFLKHLIEEHSPLRCLKCDEHFTSLADFSCLKNCVAPAESFRMGSEDTVSHFFERSFEKSCSVVQPLQPTQSTGISEDITMDTGTQYDTIESSLQHFISSASTVIVEHNKDSMTDKVVFATPYPKIKPVSKPKVAVIPRVLMDESINEEAIKNIPTIQSILEVKDCHHQDTPVSEYSATQTPMHATSTPTHPSSVPQWGMFQNTCSDSPLSEIDSPGTDNASPPVSVLKESPSTESSLSNAKSQRIKSIIAHRRRMEGQDSSEKCVTFADSVTVQTDGEISTERLKHEETEFGSPKPKVLRMPIKKVFRRPRNQTPGPAKPSKRSNPRFQAILNQFQNSSRMNLGSNGSSSDTPSGIVNLPARALLFQQMENPELKSGYVDNSPLPEIKDSVINGENAVACVESPLDSRELFKSCIDNDSPALDNAKSSTESTSQDDLNTLSKNIASCIKRSIDSALDIEDGRAELHIKVTFTKTRNVTHIQRNQDWVDENNTQTTTIWTSIARAVKGVIWGAVDGATVKSTLKKISELPVQDVTTSLTQRSLPEDDSATKRKLQELSDPVQSPLNHKKFRFEGRIKGRRPIDRMLRGNISGLERSNSAGGVDLVKRIDQSFKNKENDLLNHSF